MTDNIPVLMGLACAVHHVSLDALQRCPKCLEEDTGEYYKFSIQQPDGTHKQVWLKVKPEDYPFS